MVFKKIKFTLSDGVTHANKINKFGSKDTLTDEQIKNKVLAEDLNTIVENFNALLDELKDKNLAILNGEEYTLLNQAIASYVLDSNESRKNFIDNVPTNTWVMITITSKTYFGYVASKSSTRANWVGFNSLTGSTGNPALESILGITLENGTNIIGGEVVGNFSTNTVEPIANLQQNSVINLAQAEQLLIDTKTSNDFDTAFNIIGNQVENKLLNIGKTMQFRHGDSIKSDDVAIGHPINKGMVVKYFDDYNNWISVVYDDKVIQHGIVKVGTDTIKFDINVEKIADWKADWNGAGDAVGTNGGWKITFTNPTNATNGNAIDFPHILTLISMKLDLIFTRVSDDETTVAPVDYPKDFLLDPDLLLGEKTENKAMWMQYNVTDALGNKWLSYTKGTDQNITLPSNKTIYDIEAINGFSNNKAKWYNHYTGEYLPKRLAYLTKENFDIFADNTKIIVELHRSDDQTTGTFTEYLNLELRPVIENGIVNLHKVNIKNMGIFTGGPNTNLKALVDNVTDANKEIAQAAHIHYIDIKFRGGK